MTKAREELKQPDPNIEDAIRRRILAHVAAINGQILTRLGTVSDDLDAGCHRAALGGLDGIERQLQMMHSLLLLLP
jgi:hypothetical protein